MPVCVAPNIKTRAFYTPDRTRGCFPARSHLLQPVRWTYKVSSRTAKCAAAEFGEPHAASLARTNSIEFPNCQRSLPSSPAAGCLAHQTSRSSLVHGLPIWLLAATCVLPNSSAASGLSCPGMRGYALQQCLKQQRKLREAEEEEQEPRDKYEQPGELVTLPSGLQYREISVGEGLAAQVGAQCEIRYTVYRLSSGGYYKYSGGGTPVYMWSLGYGNEGRDDIGEVYRFRLGDLGALPRAVAAAVQGMRPGGRRRVLVPPQLGWTSDRVGPRPPSFGASRRLATHSNEALLVDVEMVRVRPPQDTATAEQEELSQLQLPGGQPFKLPAPPRPSSSS